MWMHGNWIMGPGWEMGWLMPFGGVWFLILVAVVIAVLLSRSSRHHAPQRSTALDLLEQRYAKGEIGRDEYLQKRADILGHSGS